MHGNNEAAFPLGEHAHDRAEEPCNEGASIDVADLQPSVGVVDEHDREQPGFVDRIDDSVDRLKYGIGRAHHLAPPNGLRDLAGDLTLEKPDVEADSARTPDRARRRRQALTRLDETLLTLLRTHRSERLGGCEELLQQVPRECPRLLHRLRRLVEHRRMDRREVVAEAPEDERSHPGLAAAAVSDERHR